MEHFRRRPLRSRSRSKEPRSALLLAEPRRSTERRMQRVGPSSEPATKTAWGVANGGARRGFHWREDKRCLEREEDREAAQESTGDAVKAHCGNNPR
jgi:hypothetical protein